MALGEITRTLETNTDGLKQFFNSIYNLSKRIKGWGSSFINMIINLFVVVYSKLKSIV
jgi:hypothetical protein